MPFRKLGSLTGRGRLLGREDYDFGPVRYRLEAFRGTHLMAGTGQLVAHPTALFDAAKAPQTFLELDSGERVEIVLNSAVAQVAEFKTSGVIPGF